MIAFTRPVLHEKQKQKTFDGSNQKKIKPKKNIL
jgi:hypothetical protein